MALTNANARLIRQGMPDIEAGQRLCRQRSKPAGKRQF